jgi:hypothetical protein
VDLHKYKEIRAPSDLLCQVAVSLVKNSKLCYFGVRYFLPCQFYFKLKKKYLGDPEVEVAKRTFLKKKN